MTFLLVLFIALLGYCTHHFSLRWDAPCRWLLSNCKWPSAIRIPLYTMLCTAVYNHLGLNIYFNQLLIFGNQTRKSNCYLPHEVISFQLHCMPFPYYYALSLNIIHMTQFLKISFDFYLSRFFWKFLISSKSGIAFLNSKSVRFYSKSSWNPWK